MKPKLFSCINLICDEVLKNKYFLTELDCAIGDGDLGINMARGFDSINEILNARGIKVVKLMWVTL